PVGRVERLRRWCRRNPDVATLATLLIAALATGLAASTYFAVRAGAMAAEAKGQRDRAIRVLNDMRALTAEWADEAGRSEYGSGGWPLNRLGQLSRFLLESQQGTGVTAEERLASFDGHVERMKDVEALEKAELKVGRGTVADELEARFYRVEAEYLRARAAAG